VDTSLLPDARLHRIRHLRAIFSGVSSQTSTMAERSPNWVQPSWSTSYLSVQKILSKFIYSDNLKNRTSALTSNDAVAEAVDEDLKDCQPWDRLALLHRLKTFRCAQCA
jgi:fructosamine-3-kinase